MITVGDEILIGQVTDTNAVFIARELNKIGVAVGEMVTVSDEPGQIRETLDRYMGVYDLLIMTGGLGPTKDDLTKETLADYFGCTMVTVPEVLEKITAFFKERGRTMIESNTRQADVPEACQVLMNMHGSAPGMWFEKEGSILIALPGVPYEMKGLMEDEVLPRIRERAKVPEVVHRTIMTQGEGESFLAVLLKDWESNLPECVKLAYLPRPGIVRLRLSISGKCASDAESILDDLLGKLSDIIPKYIFGYDDISLEKALGLTLKEKKLSIATAESCTGGNIAHLLTSVPGSSDYYSGSVIAYQNEVKTSVLKVGNGVINTHGAVSKPVVEQMVRGVMKVLGSDTAIATSGVAGPGGGSPGKPVGTTWISVAYKEEIYSKKFLFWGTRERIIDQASFAAMMLLRRMLLDLL